MLAFLQTLGLERSADHEPGATRRRGAPISEHYERRKRICDMVISASALVVLSPLLVLVAILVKLTDWGPVFFVQTRIGKDGQPFNCLKFRSMRINAEREREALKNEHADQRTFKMRRDPRITWIGRLIRKSSIDEMPQLWNVLRGDMSLVGPRPPCPNEVAMYGREDWGRLRVKPGLTCIWQVSGRGDLPFEQQLRMDLAYVDNRSLELDLKLLVSTIPAVLTARGAY